MIEALSALNRPQRPDLDLSPDYNCAELMTALKKKLGLSDSVIAKHLDVTIGAVCHYRLGRRKPSRHVIFRLKRLCDMLLYDIDVEQLLR